MKHEITDVRFELHIKKQVTTGFHVNKKSEWSEYRYKLITGITDVLLLPIPTLQYNVHVLQITFKLQLLKCNYTRIGIYHVLQITCTKKPLY